MIKTYAVEGMSCQHCVNSVTEEINKVPGTQGVTVDLAAGTVAVTGQGFTDSQIAAAIDEAGFNLVN